MIPYLSLPAINICPEIKLNPKDIMYTSTHPGFISYLIKDRVIIAEIKKIFNSVLGSDIKTIVWFQNIDSQFNGYIHSDPRDYAITYILDTGGPNVVTSMHHKNNNISYSVELEPNRWHIIKTKELHSVNNITLTRKSITISVGESTNKHFLNFCESIFAESK